MARPATEYPCGDDDGVYRDGELVSGSEADVVRKIRFYVPAGLPSKDIHAAKGRLRAEVIATAMSAGKPDR